MTVQEVLEKIRDENVPDQELFDCLKDFLADKYDDAGNIVPVTFEQAKTIEQLGKLVRRMRPRVTEMLKELVVQQHRNCCCADLP